ncbi:TfoX C-terminal domain-containing protein [Roseivivax lentus]|uniref:TfoX C-terminal domain-containing protein n=1 Tax=Roseivivax lentus TaxID=633194 RepID=A0A1N7N1L4_9RHOB|nr:TfoX/Sxy family protein [Roseivivax lentus]SIS92081.1 TfoX C-terminal domain-containing protein [Roseivivax lentus]
MSTPVSAIRGLGPAMETACSRAGIHSAEELRALGGDAAYLRLVTSGTRPHFIGYYALHMALQGRPWNDLGTEEKAAFRTRFDALMSEARSRPGDGDLPPDLRAALDRFGVR